MCGICGIIPKSPEPLARLVGRMNAAQAHRGPDGTGLYLAGDPPRVFFEDEGPPEMPALCGLGHRPVDVIYFPRPLVQGSVAQGGAFAAVAASLCPGLICSSPFGAIDNRDASRRSAAALDELVRPCPANRHASPARIHVW